MKSTPLPSKIQLNGYSFDYLDNLLELHVYLDLMYLIITSLNVLRENDKESNKNKKPKILSEK